MGEIFVVEGVGDIDNCPVVGGVGRGEGVVKFPDGLGVTVSTGFVG